MDSALRAAHMLAAGMNIDLSSRALILTCIPDCCCSEAQLSLYLENQHCYSKMPSALGKIF
jgi:hypothetical protein